MKILANDGIDAAGKHILESQGFYVETQRIEQDRLSEAIGDFDAIIVRSATQVTREIIAQGAKLKVIGRAGVGLDNIDRVAAEEYGVSVLNTPAASSASVAELVFAHLYGGVRFLHQSNRHMPSRGKEDFNQLKKDFSKGIELRGKTLGILGFGRIGQETARIAIGAGMHVLAYDPYVTEAVLDMEFHPSLQLASFKVVITTSDLDTVLKQSDFITLHVPKSGQPIIGREELGKMKKGSGLINCARGGVVDEDALAEALTSGHIAFAGVDVFEKEPPVNEVLLGIGAVSLTPHIGASTLEAQERVGIELANKIVSHLSSVKGA
jgi:D-3-phosphoglycerate dehydrogenase / 2-oxoglutarate reductase